MSTYRIAWPVEMPELGREVLIAQAAWDLPDLLWESGLQQDGPVAWEFVGTDLIATLAVQPWVDPARDKSRRAVFSPATHLDPRDLVRR